MDALLFLQQPQLALPICAAVVVAIWFRWSRWVAVYVALMPLINWSFAAVPTTPIPESLGGGQFQPLAIRLVRSGP